jgi:hypothetical protein
MAEHDCRGVTARIDRTNHVHVPIDVKAPIGQIRVHAVDGELEMWQTAEAAFSTLVSVTEDAYGRMLPREEHPPTSGYLSHRRRNRACR